MIPRLKRVKLRKFCTPIRRQSEYDFACPGCGVRRIVGSTARIKIWGDPIGVVRCYSCDGEFGFEYNIINRDPIVVRRDIGRPTLADTRNI